MLAHVLVVVLLCFGIHRLADVVQKYAPDLKILMLSVF